MTRTIHESDHDNDEYANENGDGDIAKFAVMIRRR